MASSTGLGITLRFRYNACDSLFQECADSTCPPTEQPLPWARQSFRALVLVFALNDQSGLLTR